MKHGDLLELDLPGDRYAVVLEVNSNAIQIKRFGEDKAAAIKYSEKLYRQAWILAYRNMMLYGQETSPLEKW